MSDLTSSEELEAGPPEVSSLTAKQNERRQRVLRAAFDLATEGGYEAGAINGNADNADNSISFTGQEFERTDGPDQCFTPGSFTATYGPVQTADGSPVFVN